MYKRVSMMLSRHNSKLREDVKQWDQCPHKWSIVNLYYFKLRDALHDCISLTRKMCEETDVMHKIMHRSHSRENNWDSILVTLAKNKYLTISFEIL